MLCSQFRESWKTKILNQYQNKPNKKTKKTNSIKTTMKNYWDYWETEAGAAIQKGITDELYRFGLFNIKWTWGTDFND